MLIIDVLGNKFNEIKLYDDNSLSTGGISRSEETLEDFMKDAKIDPFDDVGKLQKALKECGIRQIEEIDRAIEEAIQQRIWDIEKDFNVDIIDYRWDYKGF